jgi:hypothetical protein
MSLFRTRLGSNADAVRTKTPMLNAISIANKRCAREFTASENLRQQMIRSGV